MTRRQALARAYVDALYADLRNRHAHIYELLAWLDRQYAARLTERVLDDKLAAYLKAHKPPI